MIIFFGPAGAGKSMQGQILAARHGWRWLSSGQLLRDAKDPAIVDVMNKGQLVSDDQMNELVVDALERAKDINNIVLDGYPRRADQAKYLLENAERYGREIDLVIVVEVPRAELEKRMRIRGRVDDTTEAIEERLSIYRHQIYPTLGYLADKKVRITHIDGTGPVGQIHDRIEAELVSLGIVPSITED